MQITHECSRRYKWICFLFQPFNVYMNWMCYVADWLSLKNYMVISCFRKFYLHFCFKQIWVQMYAFDSDICNEHKRSFDIFSSFCITCKFYTIQRDPDLLSMLFSQTCEGILGKTGTSHVLWLIFVKDSPWYKRNAMSVLTLEIFYGLQL